MSLTYGELCAGYGGLFEGVQSVLGGELAWYSEFDAAPSKVMAYHHPDVPNIGDMTKVDWTTVEPVDVLAGGYPCQPFSHAGKRAGTNDERHLWPNIAEAVAVLRPGLCVFENVRGHLSLGFDGVLRDLEQLGYSVRWYTLRAADIGAAHGRARLFIFAEDTRNEHRVCGRPDRRRGLDRDHESSAWGDLRDQPQGQHVGQGQARAGCTGGTPWREGHTGRSRDGHPTQYVPLAVDGEGGCGGTQASGASLTHQGSALPDRTGTHGDGRGRSGRTGRGQEVEYRDERAGSNAPVADQGGESARTRPRPAETPERAADGDLQPRVVVGAGRRPVRAGGVSGEPADVRPDGCWACVRDALLERAAGVITDTDATPADAGAVGRQWRAGVERDGRDATVRGQEGGHSIDGRSASPDLTLLPTPTSSDTNGPGAHGDGGADLRTTVSLLPTPTTTQRGTDANLDTREGARANLHNEVAKLLPTPRVTQAGYADDGRGGKSLDVEARRGNNWGDYAAAITRWEHVLGSPAPEPTETGAKGNPRLSAKFCEWLMGLPAGHVTSDDIGLTRNQQLKALGNGVVVQQCAAATRAFLTDMAPSERSAS